MDKPVYAHIPNLSDVPKLSDLIPERDRFGRRPVTIQDLETLDNRLARAHQAISKTVSDVDMTLSGVENAALQVHDAIAAVWRARQALWNKYAAMVEQEREA